MQTRRAWLAEIRCSLLVSAQSPWVGSRHAAIKPKHQKIEKFEKFEKFT